MMKFKKLYGKHMNRKGNNKGFSLIELLVVIAIMVVLVGSHHT